MANTKVFQPERDERPNVVAPPAPPGESAPEAVHTTDAVAAALTQLGDDADPKRVADAVKAQTGIVLDPGEVSHIMATLREKGTVTKR